MQLILDCGTGLRMLGSRWGKEHAQQQQETHFLVTHYHWDHIQGIPFFTPLYSDQNEFHFYSFRSESLGRDSLKQVFETQMAQPYFPVDLSAMNAKRRFQEVADGDSFFIGENKISVRSLNHPQGCLGFRIETAAGSVVYATDNEPGNPALDKSLRDLAAGADIFINDAQYTPEQLAGVKRGWGHSTWKEGVKTARDAGAKTLVLFHHDPDSTDRMVDSILRQGRAELDLEFWAGGKTLVFFHHDPDSTDRMVDSILRQGREEFDSVFAASEGMVITLGSADGRVDAHMPGTRTALRREAQFRARVSGVTEGGRAFDEETLVSDLSLQGWRPDHRAPGRFRAKACPGLDPGWFLVRGK